MVSGRTASREADPRESRGRWGQLPGPRVSRGRYREGCRGPQGPPRLPAGQPSRSLLWEVPEPLLGRFPPSLGSQQWPRLQRPHIAGGRMDR